MPPAAARSGPMSSSTTSKVCWAVRGTIALSLANAQSSIGAIDGGVGGNDIPRLQRVHDADQRESAEHEATNVAAWKNLESFVGGSSAQDLFVGSSVPNSFHITGANQGQDQTLGAGNYLFAGIENLQGGSNPTCSSLCPQARQLAASMAALAMICSTTPLSHTA